MKNGIACMFIDIGGVLFSLDYQTVWDRLCLKSGRSVDEVQKALYADDIFYPFESGTIGADAYYKEVTTRLSCDISYEEFRDIWNSLLIKKERMFEIVSFVKSQVDLLVISNTNEMNAEYMEKDIKKLTDKTVYSFQAGCLKPDRRIYEHALQVAKAPVNRVLFIDDTEENIESAEALGMSSHLFTDEKGFHDLLVSLGFEIPLFRNTSYSE